MTFGVGTRCGSLTALPAFGALSAVVVGGTQLAVAFALLTKRRIALLLSAVVGFGMLIWIFVELPLCRRWSIHRWSRVRRRTDGGGRVVHDLRHGTASLPAACAIHDSTRWGMKIQLLYKDKKDEALHRRAIEKLARNLNRPIGAVKIVYEEEYTRLKLDAKVTGFIGVFASRRARAVLLRTPT